MKLSQLINRKYVAMAIFFSLLTGLDTIVIPTVVKEVTDAVQTSNPNKLIWVICFGIVGFSFLQLTLYLWNKYLAKVIEEFNIYLKKAIFQRSLVGDLEKNAVQSMVYNDVPMLSEKYVSSVVHMIYCIWYSLISIIYVTTISWRVTLIFIVFSAIPIILPKLFEKRLAKVSKEWDRKNQVLVKELDEDLRTVSVIRHYQRLNYFFNRFIAVVRQREHSEYEKTRLGHFVGLVITVVAGTVALIPFGLGGYLAIEGYLSLGGLLAVFMSSDRIFGPLENAVKHWTNIKTCIPIKEKLEKHLQKTDMVELDNHEVEKLNYQTIFFEHVGLGYDRVLYTVNAQIHKGEKILLLGPSGSGKSTLFKTLFKDIGPKAGFISFDQRMLGEIDQATLYHNIGYIPQEVYIFEGSLAFNVTLGEAFSDESIYLALSEAGLGDFVREHGLDYQVGTDGQNISGGERARLTLARAFIRHYNLILVDEFSSSLDSKVASKIREILFATQATVIEISHHIDENQKNRYDQIWEVSKDRLKIQKRIGSHY